MAKAEITKSEVIVTLTLNKWEAEALLKVCGNISGPNTGPRGCTSEIGDALYNVGIKADNVVRPIQTMTFPG
jgi:hypothetical protein